MGLLSSVGRVIKGLGNVLSLDEAMREITSELHRPGCRPETYSDSIAASAYRSWVYVAASFNADAVSSGVLGAYSTVPVKSGSVTRTVTGVERKHLERVCRKALPLRVDELVDHPIVGLLNAPNAYDSRSSFVFKIDLFLELVGDAYVLIERGGRGNVPVALHVLYSQHMHAMLDGANRVLKWCYGVARDGKFEYEFDPGDIIHLKFFDPADAIYGISPLQAAFRGVGLINAMSTYEEALNQNMGQPAGVLKYNSKVIQAENRKEIEQRWHEKFAGVGRAGKLVVTDQDVDYASIGITPRDMVFMDGRKWSREEILCSYRLPMAMLLTEGVNRSNMEIARENFHQWTVAPRRQLISDGLTRGLLRGTLAEGSVLLAFADDSPVDQEVLMKKSTLLANSKAITRNELRGLMRMDLEDMEEGGDEIVGQEAAMVDAQRRGGMAVTGMVASTGVTGAVRGEGKDA